MKASIVEILFAGSRGLLAAAPASRGIRRYFHNRPWTPFRRLGTPFQTRRKDDAQMHLVNALYLLAVQRGKIFYGRECSEANENAQKLVLDAILGFEADMRQSSYSLERPTCGFNNSKVEEP